MCNYVIVYVDTNERVNFDYVMADSFKEAKNKFTIKNPCYDIVGVYVSCADIRMVLLGII